MRTVKVGLLLEAARYIRGARESKQATKDVAESVDDLADSGRRAGQATDELSGGLQDLAADARRLDTQISEGARSIRDLARQIVATADEAERADIVKKLDLERLEQLKRVSLRKLIDVDSAAEVGGELASNVSMSFAARLGPLLARAPMAGMNPAVVAIGAPIAAGLVTLLGTATAGAIVGGVGAGGVIGGLALAAKDPAVKAAGKELVEDLSAMLGRASSAFVPETLDAIDSIGDRALKLEPKFNRAFSSASRLVDPLVDGLLDGAENALPGFIDVLDSAGPVIDVVADAARDLGSAVGEGLSDLAPYADEGARALQILFTVMEGGVVATFALLEAMAKLYGVAEIIGAVMTGNIGRVVELAYAQRETEGSTVDLTGVIGNLGTGMRNLGEDTITAEDAAKELKTAFDELFGEQMGYDRALIAYKDGIAELNKELREGKRTLDTNTQAGRDNVTGVLDQIDRIKELREARLAQGESLDTVNAKYGKDLEGLRATLLQLGYNKTEVDALIGKYKAVPELVATRVSADVIQAERELAKVRSLIKQIRSKKVVITTQHNIIVTRSEGRNVPIGDGVGGRRWGGITEHAQWGVLRQAHVASPVATARYAYAEQATGGEAFIPRFGDYQRSLAIWEHVGREWLGALPRQATQAPVSQRFVASGGGVSRTLVLQVANHGVIGSRLQLENWLTGAIDNLRRRGRI